MQRTMAIILSLMMVINLLLISADVVNAEEVDVIWLNKEYDEVSMFNNGMAKVGVRNKEDSKYGFIDTRGKEVISPKYDLAEDFTKEGLSKVKLNDKYGFVDEKGREIIPLKYDFVGGFSEGLSRVVLNDKAGFIDTKGKEVIPLKYDWVGDFSEGLVRIRLDDKYGFIDKRGKEVLPCKYEWAGDFSEGLSAIGSNWTRGGGQGYIDKTGKKIIPYGGAYTFSEGLVRIDCNFPEESSAFAGYMNRNGEIIIPPIYLEQFAGSGWHFEETEDFQHYEAEDRGVTVDAPSFSEGLVSLGNQDWKYGCLDKDGKEIIPFKYMGPIIFSEGLAPVTEGDYPKFISTYIDKMGKEVLRPNYDYLYLFNEGLAQVGKRIEGNYKYGAIYGYIDKKGREIIPVEFETATDFNEGLAIVTYLGKQVIIRNPIEFKNAEINIKKEMDRIGYSGYKKVYYDYLNKFTHNKEKFFERSNSFSEDAILIDLDKDGIPELITYHSSWGGEESFETLNILRFNNDKIKSDILVNAYSGGRYNESIKLYKDKNLDNYYVVKHGEALSNLNYGWGSNIFKIIKNELQDYREYVFREETYVDGIIWTVNGEEVDKEEFDKRNKEYEDFLDSFVEIFPKDVTDDLLSEEKIRKILDSYIDKPIEISYTFDKLFSITGSKKLLKLNLSEKDAELSYEVDNPEIVQVTEGGEIVALKEGNANIKVIASKLGYKDGEITIPITIKPRLNIDFTRIGSSSNSDEDIKYLREILEESDSLYFEDSDTLTEISKLINFIIKKNSRDSIKSSKNIININGKTVKKSIDKSKQIKKSIEDLIDKENVALNRILDSTIRLDGINIKEDKAIGLRLESSMIKPLKDIDFVNISLEELEITLNTKGLDKEFENSDVIQIEIKTKENQGQESYEIAFIDENGNDIERLENNITISIPINNENPEYNTVFFNDGKAIQELGGQYDSITNTMEFGTKFPGEYYIVKNQKDYKDIGHLDQEIQDAITFMTSKGFIDGRDDDNFEPDEEITREEFTAFLVNTFYVLDKALSSSFTDVEKDNLYYNHIASSEKEGIIKGYPNKTFQGENIINREQIVAVAARALHEKKKYIYPENIKDYLLFIDTEDIGDWAKNDIALAYRETLIDMPDNRYFEPQKSMTRADATIIIYRLFQLLYETSPSELESVETSNNSLPIIPIAGGGGLVGLGFLGRYILKRKKIIG